MLAGEPLLNRTRSKMKDTSRAIALITLALSVMGLTGCEGPGPEYHTPMPSYPEREQKRGNAYQYPLLEETKANDEEIYREQRQQNLRTSLFFDSGKPQISPTQKQILIKQARYLKQNPRAIIRVEGHSHAKGREANEVAKFLNAQGISSKRIHAVTGQDPQAHSKNRGVKLIILPEGK